ncbi:MAG: nitrate/nitrite transporter [Sulfurifustaceae bacterium]
MAATEANPGPKRHWLRIFLPFAAGYYLSYLLRNANAVIAPELRHELNLSAADLGLLTSAYFFAFGAFQVPLGILLDRYGPRRVEAVLMLFAAAGTLLFALGHDVTGLAVGRALIGLGVSACLMAALKNFAQWYPAERQSSLTGAIMTAGMLGAITVTVPMEMLLPVLGWRGIFLSITAIILATTVWFYFAVPDHASEAPKTTLAEQLRGVGQIFASRHFWRFAPLMTLFSGGYMAVQGLWVVPWFINAEGLTRETAAQHLFAMTLSSLVSFFAIALFSTRLIQRGVKLTLLVGGLLMISWTCFALIVAGVRPALPLWLIFSFCTASTTLMYTALAANFAPALFGRVSTALNLMAFVGAFTLQWGIGLLIDLFAAGGDTTSAFRTAFAIVAAVQLLAWGWFVLEGRRRTALAAAARPVPPQA